MPLPQRAKNLLTPARRAQARRWLVVLTVRGLGGVAGFGATVVATRVLGADQAGLLLLAFAVVTVVATLTRLGLDNALVRFIGAHAAENNWQAINGVFRLAIRWTLMTSLPASVLLLVLSDPIARHLFDKPDLAPVLQWMSLLTAPMALYWLHAQGFIGLKRPEVATLLQNISLPLLFAVLLLLTAWQGIASATIGAAAWLIAGTITLALAAVLWWRQPDTDWKSGAFERARLWHSAAPLWAVAAMGMAVQWSGQLAAGAWLAPADVAHLAAAQRTAVLISLILMVTNMFIAPRFAAMHHAGRMDDLKHLARLATRLMLLLATPIAAVMIFAAEPVMRLFGDGFGAASTLLIILVIGQWVNAVTGSVGFLLSMTGHERDLRNITLASGGAGILLAVLLTPTYGTVGAAWATALAITLQNVAALLMVRWRLGFFTIGL